MGLEIDIRSIGHGGAVVYWCTGDHENDIDSLVGLIVKSCGDIPFTLVSVKTDCWNADFSPWAAEKVFGKDSFEGNGPRTLQYIRDVVMPDVEKDSSPVRRYIAGYSLAGLFSLWSMLETDLFDGAASCSGSLWYPGWLEYLRDKAPSNGKRIYLSLGDKEEKVRNQMVSKVGDNTRQTFELLHQSNDTTLEWNPGGHFSNPMPRLAQGISFLLKSDK